MSYVKNGTPIGGTSLPTASGAGELPVSDGAGTAYTATAVGDVVGAGLVAVLGGEVAGTALVSDGAGDVTMTSADVAAFNAAANAAAARASIGAATPPAATVYDFASSTGFTTANGAAGTASITAGVARLSNPAGTAHRTATVAYDGPSITRALPSPVVVDVAVRVAVMPAVSGTNLTLEISNAATAGTRVCAGVRDTGEAFFYRNDFNSTLATAAGAFASFTGQQWLRVCAIPGFVRVYYGTGVGGARPTSWTQVGSALALSALWTHVTMGLIVVATASTSTADLDDLTVAPASELSL